MRPFLRAVAVLVVLALAFAWYKGGPGAALLLALVFAGIVVFLWACWLLVQQLS